MTVTEAWAVLGLEPTDDAGATKRAYSRLLKQIDVDRDPKGFIRLREALELALHYGAEIPDWERDDYDDAAAWHDDGAAGPEETQAPDDEGDGETLVGAWQPAPPPEGASALALASQRLNRLLFDQEPVEPAEIAAAGAALLAEMDKAPLDEAANTERWLLGALVDAIPRSDPLIGPAMDHFGWDNAVRPRDYGFGYDLDTLHQRRGDRARLDRILSFSPQAAGAFSESLEITGDQRAARELGRGGRTRVSPFELLLAADVRSFLNTTLAAHPMMEHDLDRGQLAFWRGYFERRHLPDHFWLIVLPAPPILAFAMMVGAKLIGVAPPLSFLPATGVALAATLIAILAYVELRFRTAARDRARHDYGYRSGPAKYWLAASLALPPLAGLTPSGLVAGIGWSAAALAVAIGTFLTTWTPERAQGEDALGPPALSGSTLIGCAAVTFALIPTGPAHLVGPLLALCYASYRGHEAAALAMRKLSAKAARSIIAGAGLLAAAAMAPLFLYIPGPPPPALLMLVPVAAAAAHLATAHLFVSTGALEWGARTIGILFYLIAARALFEGRDKALVVAIMVYILLYATARTIVAFRQEVAAGGTEPPAYF